MLSEFLLLATGKDFTCSGFSFPHDELLRRSDSDQKLENQVTRLQPRADLEHKNGGRGQVF